MKYTTGSDDPLEFDQHSDDAVPNEDDEEKEIEFGEDEIDCEDELEAVENPDETFIFAAAGEVRAFVNQRCNVGISPHFDNAGQVHNDQVTADAVCKLKGFQTALITSDGKYSSAHDNFMGEWVEAEKTFVIIDMLHNGDPHNNYIKSLTCSGKLAEKCVPQEKFDCVIK